MKLVTMILTVMSLASCRIGGYEASKAKFKPEKKEISVIDEYDLLTDPDISPNDVLVYVWAKANKEGFPPQYFVIRTIVNRGTVVRVRVRAVDKNLMPLSQNDCIDEFVASDVSHYKRSFERKRGEKSIHIKFKKKDITSMITQFEYTTIDTRGATVTYKYTRPRHYNPDIVDISLNHIEKLKEGEYCD